MDAITVRDPDLTDIFEARIHGWNVAWIESLARSTQVMAELLVGSPGNVQKHCDENRDGTLDISDPIEVLDYLFVGRNRSLSCGDGTVKDPANLKLHDLNGDGQIDISDPVYALNYLFTGGPPPRQGTHCRPIAGCPRLSGECET